MIVPIDGKAEWRVRAGGEGGGDEDGEMNNVRVTVGGPVEMDVKVVPITEGEDRAHGYRLPPGDGAGGGHTRADLPAGLHEPGEEGGSAANDGGRGQVPCGLLPVHQMHLLQIREQGKTCGCTCIYTPWDTSLPLPATRTRSSPSPGDRACMTRTHGSSPEDWIRPPAASPASPVPSLLLLTSSVMSPGFHSSGKRRRTHLKEAGRCFLQLHPQERGGRRWRGGGGKKKVPCLPVGGRRMAWRIYRGCWGRRELSAGHRNL
ncbi:hypothetical protein BHE74_00017283 [Ensete ventricosum]|nr:hypothetical protein BHE74_00017283 [Ensete ventricosum]